MKQASLSNIIFLSETDTAGPGRGIGVRKYSAALLHCRQPIRRKMNMKYVCSVCGYEYDEVKGDPDNGIEPGTKWEDLPEDFACPLCGVGKDQFEEA